MKLLAQLDDRGSKKEAATRLAQLGLRPIRPALFDAYLFDGAVDTPEDIHHIGPLGIGLFLLSNLPSALKVAFPSTRVCGHARRAVFPSSIHGGPYLVLAKGDHVTWDSDEANRVKEGHVWAEIVEDGNRGFVPLHLLLIDRQHDYDWRFALNQVDEALRRMGREYVRSYKGFDFPSLGDIVEKKWKSEDVDIDVFSRATTTEQALLFLTYALPSIITQDTFAWITKTFLLYNKIYWTWRREVFFESDFDILNAHQMEWKKLMMDHWAVFSKTNLCTAKFHGIDHILEDIRCHGVPRHTGSGPGDHAHIEKAKKPFKMSSKSKDQNNLNKQLIAFGLDGPSLCEKEGQRKKVRAVVPNRLRGKGFVEVLNHYVVKQVRVLRSLNWDVQFCNAPVMLWRA